jgi:hypothetical protein
MGNKTEYFTCVEVEIKEKANTAMFLVVMAKPCTKTEAEAIQQLLKNAHPNKKFEVYPVGIVQAYVNVLGAEYLTITPKDEDEY